jgi:superfamily II DNA or RNA helicase
MNTDKFNIQIEDGSEQVSDFSLKENIKYLNLFNWQQEAINFFFNSNCKALYEVVTGAGKTLLAIELIKNILLKDPTIRVLIVVPKNVILETGWYKELYDHGINLDKIGVFYGAIKEYSQVTITNMQSLDKVAFDMFDCVVLDECHNYGTKKLMKILEVPKKYVIGLTATVERHDNRHLLLYKLFDFNIFTYSPREALRDGILNPFVLHDVGVECSEDFLEEYTKLSTEINTIMVSNGGYGKIMRSNTGLKNLLLKLLNERKQMINNYERKFDVIKIICEKHKKDNVIVFNEFNEMTNKLYWHLLDAGIKTCIFHSGINKDLREQNLIDFKKGKYNIMLATKVLDEGVNIPKMDVGIIMAGNSTKKQTIQRLGRVLRKKEHESVLYQIYCNSTIEEEYSVTRSKLFKQLCTKYYKHLFTLEGELK